MHADGRREGLTLVPRRAERDIAEAAGIDVPPRGEERAVAPSGERRLAAVAHTSRERTLVAGTVRVVEGRLLRDGCAVARVSLVLHPGAGCGRAGKPAVIEPDRVRRAVRIERER